MYVSQKNESSPQPKSPWGYGTIFAVSYLGGFAAGGIIAGLNWRRVGKHRLVWPTIVSSIIGFVVFLVIIGFMDIDYRIGSLVNIGVAAALSLWQRGAHHEWKRANPNAQSAGWSIPVVLIVIIGGVFLGVYFLPQLLPEDRFIPSGDGEFTPSADGQFNIPVGIAVDSSGNVYVADSGNDHVQKFDSEGRFILKWGSKGSGDGEFNIPHYMALGSSGSIYAVNAGNGHVQKFGSP